MVARGVLAISLFGFHIMEDHDADYALNETHSPLSQDQADKFIEHVRTQLNGRCKGLVEVHDVYVVVLHRTLWVFSECLTGRLHTGL